METENRKHENGDYSDWERSGSDSDYMSENHVRTTWGNEENGHYELQEFVTREN